MKYKRTLLAVIAGFMTNMGVMAQGMPVMDITNILASVQNGYTMVEQLQAMYTNLRTSYDQLQRQIKNFETFDFNQLDARDPLGSWNSINTYADRMKIYGENVGTIINKKDIKIGNESYSLYDIFTSPSSISVQNLLQGGSNLSGYDLFERMLSPEEKAFFHQKFGMAYGYYVRLNQMGGMLKKKSTEVIGYAKNLQKNLAEDRERLQSIAENLFGSESMIQQQQVNNAVMSILAQDIKTQADLLGNIAEQLSMYFAQMQTTKDAMMDELNMNALEFSEGFMKILGEMAPPDAFR